MHLVDDLLDTDLLNYASMWDSLVLRTAFAASVVWINIFEGLQPCLEGFSRSGRFDGCSVESLVCRRRRDVEARAAADDDKAKISYTCVLSDDNTNNTNWVPAHLNINPCRFGKCFEISVSRQLQFERGP